MKQFTLAVGLFAVGAAFSGSAFAVTNIETITVSYEIAGSTSFTALGAGSYDPSTGIVSFGQGLTSLGSGYSLSYLGASTTQPATWTGSFAVFRTRLS